MRISGLCCLLTLWPLLQLGACTMHNPETGIDGPGGEDLAGHPGPDGSTGGHDGSVGPACADILAAVTSDLNASTSCTVDSDCVVATTACGLPGACGAYENKDWHTAQMSQLLQEWAADQCGTACVCPQLTAPPACNMGVCGPKMSGTGTGAVGAACTQDSDCQSGQCLTESEDPAFTGGYCTVKGCAQDSCPSGSACRGNSGEVPICLADCALKSPTPACRSGYSCCSGPIIAGMGGWCVPPDAPLCVEL